MAGYQTICTVCGKVEVRSDLTFNLGKAALVKRNLLCLNCCEYTDQIVVNDIKKVKKMIKKK